MSGQLVYFKSDVHESVFLDWAQTLPRSEPPLPPWVLCRHIEERKTFPCKCCSQ